MTTSPDRDAALARLLDGALELTEAERSAYLEREAPDAQLAREAEHLLREEGALGTFLARPAVAPAPRRLSGELPNEDPDRTGTGGASPSRSETPSQRRSRTGESHTGPRSTDFFDLLSAVLDAPPEERSRILTERTADASAAERVLAFLAGQEVAPDSADGDADASLRWGRFRIVRLLGSGGMGMVFEAVDTELERRVAVKVVRSMMPSLLGRFEREARAQARIDHENVCRVYEVGEEEGLPFIVMQLLPGRTLRECVGDLGLEEKVRVLADAAEGLHAAHREGLIHRDVKPGNVMVERRDDGSLGVRVMDFGIAHELEGPELTRTGAALGTPHYMAPEQAAGRDGIDRRTDVYGLGATLYKALTGRSPFHGHTGIEVLHLVLHDDPPSPRQTDPRLPRDLETIVLRAMDKDPARRYDSARGFARDLHRYLDGEPIEARRSSLVYRWRRHLRKHRGAVAVAAVGLVAVGLAVASAVRERWQAQARAEAAQRFGSEVATLVGLERASHQMPLHDVRPDRELLRERMRGIEEAMVSLGAPARGPGLQALGVGRLALDDLDGAERALREAWDEGYREPEVGEAYGRVLAERWALARDDARRIPDEAARRERLEALDRELREPALELLRLGREADLEAPELTEARIALLEERYDDAVDLARAALARLPWRYGGHTLIGDAASARAADAQTQGDYDTTETLYAEAEEAYRRAVEIGNSDPRSWLALCGLASSRARTAQDRRAADATPHYDAALEACERGLRADPDHLGLLEEKARLTAFRGAAAVERREDPGSDLDVAAAASRRLIELAPEAAAGWASLALATATRADWESFLGDDARPSYDEAIDALDRALTLDPARADARLLLAFTLRNRGLEAERREEDPDPWLARSEVEILATIEQMPRMTNAYLTASGILWKRAWRANARGEDGLPAIEKGIELLRRVLEIDPELGFAYVNLGVFLDDAAELSFRDRDADPGARLDEAIATFGAAIDRVPDDAFAHLNLGHTLNTRAQWAAGQREDPLPWLRRARASFERGIALAPGISGAPAGLGTSWWLEALVIEESGGDPEPALERAATEALASRDRSAADPAHRILAALVASSRVRLALQRGLFLAGELEDATRSLEEARAEGRDAQRVALAEATLGFEAAWAAHHAGREEPRVADRGRERVAALLDRDPEMPQAQALRAGFLLLDAAHAGPGAEERGEELRREARETLSGALDRDPSIRLTSFPVRARADGADQPDSRPHPPQPRSRPRRARKNVRRSSPHSSSRTPPTISTRWFSASCRAICRTDPAAPVFGSNAPKTSRPRRAWTMAPAHIGHGSRVT